MRFYDIISRTASSLLIHKLRTLLTAGAISIGVASLSLGLGLVNAFEESAMLVLGSTQDSVTVRRVEPFELGDRVGVSEVDPFDPNQDISPESSAEENIDGFIGTLSEEDIAAISSVEGVESVITNYDFNARYIEIDNQTLNLSAIDVLSVSSNISYASAPIASLMPGEIVLNDIYARTLNKTSSDLVGETVRIGLNRNNGETIEEQFTVVAIENETLFEDSNKRFGSNIYVSVKDAAILNSAILEADESDWQPTELLAILGSGAEEGSVRTDIVSIDPDLTVLSNLDVLQGLESFSNTVSLALSGVSGVILMTAAFGIINTLLIGVFERKSEVGLFRALGAKRSNILLLFVAEAAFLGFIGSAFGVFVAFVAQIIVNIRFIEEIEQIGATAIIAITPLDTFLVICGAVIISILAGLYPAYRAQKIEPISALRDL